MEVCNVTMKEKLQAHREIEAENQRHEREWKEEVK